jgi:eukaryotic-like serine/threonine-protein kinase
VNNKIEIIASGCSDIGHKDENKDSYNYVMPMGDDLTSKGIVAVIADGVSSSEGGGEAARTSTKTFIEDYYSTSDAWSVKISAQKVLTALNRWLYRNGQNGGSVIKGWVTTFSAIIFKSTTAHLLHVGDSRIYRFRAGQLELLTEDHAVPLGDNKTYLSRALGIDLKLSVDYQSCSLEQGDVFLLSTDGLHDFVSYEYLRHHLSVQSSIDDIASRLVQVALENGANDNVTALLLRVENLPEETEEEVFDKLSALPFPPDLVAGNKIDKFEILQALSTGVRGQVYLAKDIESGQKIVLKTPSASYEDDWSYVNGFIQEEWIGRRTNHPGLLKTYDAGRRKNFLYYTSEYVDGINLRQWMHDHPQPDLTDIRQIIDQLVQALRALHRQDMIHQDLKPENIMIERDGRVVIIDFGSAKVGGVAEVSSRLNFDHPMGTLNYTAPECLLGEPSSNRSDIYSLGVIVYELLAGVLPYKQLDNFKLKNYDQLVYISLQIYRKDIPLWIDRALQKSVAANPDQRHTLLSEFKHDITTPKAEYATEHAVPFMLKYPVLFWKMVSGGLFICCLLLLFNE